MPTSPTPEEREKKDAEAKAKQDEEQARLPYKWNQTISDLDITIPIGANIKGRDCDIVMTKTKLKVALKGQDPFIDVGGFFSPSLFCGCLYNCAGPNTDFSHRVPSPKKFTSMNQHGRLKPSRSAKKSASTSTKSTRWSGGTR